MPTIRIRDWTKARLDEIREQQNHSSHDSVVKTLLKDHQLAEARKRANRGPTVSEETYRAPTEEDEYAVPGMKVLAELETPKDNVGFLWCPNCDTEVAHFTFSDACSFEDFEATCPQCFTDLDHHALVAIEIDYPLERKLVEDELADDLKTAVIDYWDRRLAESPAEITDQDDRDRLCRLVWQFDQYVRDFMWEWPSDVPVVGLEAGRTYARTDADERIEVLERVPKSGSRVDAFRVRRHPADSGDEPATELLESETVCELLRNRLLEFVE
ncbi:MAG: hypothetical protein ABEJ60_04470 [Halodesulfurarchaeum sp.]